MTRHHLRIEKKKGVPISPGMIGLFYEDINYSCDGGINAEMLENPNFAFVETMGCYNRYSTKPDIFYGWIPFPTVGDGAKLLIGTDSPVHAANPYYLIFEASQNQKGVRNKAFDGIRLKKGMSYTISAYLRSSLYRGKVSVSVYDKENSLMTAVLTEQVSDQWVKYETVVTSEADVRNGQFVIELCDTSVLEIDYASMKPSDAVFGLFRRDIADILRELGPGFLRFPGGCVVEGNELSNRYCWKNTVGPVETRTSNWNRWAVHNNPDGDFSIGKYSHYNQTYAIGYYEYFMLCEYIGARPLPVQNVGLACQYQSRQLVETSADEFQEYIDEVLDLIEFANGPADSRWGKLRADMGHPEPFHLEMVGIGNEQWETEQVNFFERYTLFEQAIHDRYPDIKLIGSAGPDVTSEHYFDAWSFYHDRAKENPGITYAVDEHYYRPVEWFYQNNGFYDNYPRDVKVFSGEYAAHLNNGFNMPQLNTLGAALSEAAFLTGVERNADVVVLASYAPLLARVGYAQWSPNLIWFDDQICYKTPSYYVQKLYARNMGSFTVKNSMSTDTDRLFQSVSYDEAAGELILKLVNGSETGCEVMLDIDKAYTITDQITVTRLSGSSEAYNTVDEPEKIKPQTETITLTDMVYLAEPYSFSVIRIPAAI